MKNEHIQIPEKSKWDMWLLTTWHELPLVGQLKDCSILFLLAFKL